MTDGEMVEWMTKVNALITEAKKSGKKSLIVDAPKSKHARTINADILKRVLKVKITGEKNKEWTIILPGKKGTELK